ncbi:MAG: large-conductance mechanosensitive channel protein MscL [Clostridia bacterium]|nr:large-conductance mechanosensitive channel protein MscL [Clostridia bacterium]
MFKEFKEFIMRGNVMDMAVGVMVGAAFQKIVTSLVEDIITPLLSPITGGISFADLGVVISPAVMDGEEVIKPEVVFGYGAFIQSIIDFILVALCIFLIVKAINKLRDRVDGEKRAAAEAEAKAAAEAEAAKLTRDQELLTEIRDLLKKQ